LAGDTSLATVISTEIDSLATVDSQTIEVNEANNTIRLMETVAAPTSGTRTFSGSIVVSSGLTVNGTNVITAINNEISSRTSGDASLAAVISTEVLRAQSAEDSLEVALSTEVSYLIANTDLTSIDSFAEISNELSSELIRANSAEVSLADNFANIYFRNAGVNETANGSITEFTFGATLRTGSQAVYLNGLLQDAGDYTITTTSVTFASAPAAGDKVVVYGMY
jgi:hypothetical protein